MLQFQTNDHISHSYIIASSSEAERSRMTTELAAAMLCESADIRPCRQCRRAPLCLVCVKLPVLCRSGPAGKQENKKFCIF